MTQVTSGLKAGEQVEIADPGQALPSIATSGSTTTGRIGVGSFTFPAGGFGNFTATRVGN